VYSKSTRLRILLFWRFWNLAVFALGFFTDFEILDVFNALGFFKSKKRDKISLYSVGKSWPRKCIWAAYWHSLGYKSLLFWRGSVITVTNFHPPVKTFAPNSCLELNSILYKSQKREANEGSVHCADIEGIDVKQGSANSFGCRTPGKSQTSHRDPNKLNFSDPTTSQIRGQLD